MSCSLDIFFGSIDRKCATGGAEGSFLSAMMKNRVKGTPWSNDSFEETRESERWAAAEETPGQEKDLVILADLDAEFHAQKCHFELVSISVSEPRQRAKGESILCATCLFFFFPPIVLPFLGSMSCICID